MLGPKGKLVAAGGSGRHTFAYEPPRPDKAAVTLKHTLTTGLAERPLGSTLSSTMQSKDKRDQLALVLEENLNRRFGGTPALREYIAKEVASAFGAGARITPESMKALQDKVAARVLQEGAPSQLKSTAKAVLSSTSGQRVTSAATGSVAASPLRVAPTAAARSASAGPAGRPKKSGAERAMEAMHDLDSADERRDSHAGFRAGGSSESTPRWGDDTSAADGVDTIQALNTIKDLVLADPEPEKVLGLLEDAQVRLAAKQRRERLAAEHATVRATLQAAEAEKHERKAREKQLDSMWKHVVESNMRDMEARERAEAAAAQRREAEQRAMREHQVKLSRDQHARELAEARAYEMFQLKLSLAADEARRQEAARELEAKRVLVKRQMAENFKAREVKAAAAERRRLEEKRAMEEYNAMSEAQAAARAEAVKAVYGRQDVLLSIAAEKRRAQIQREEEEKARTLSEFDEARRAIAEAERAEHVAKLERASEFRRVLTEQVDEKQERDARLKADEARTRDLLAARARVEVEELKAVRQRAVEKHGEYRNMLMKQIEAARKLQELKRGAEREDILRALDSLEGNEALLMDVSSRLGERARAAQSAKALAEAQAEALREALEAVTARSHK